jgi:transposase
MRTPGDSKTLLQRRIYAVRRVLEEKGSRAQVAAELGVHLNSIGLWVRLFRKGGPQALQIRVATGRPPKLNARQVRDVVQCVLRGAPHCGFDTDLWTLPRIAQLIKKRHGVELDVDHLSRLMRQWGLSWQKPARRPLERNEKAITQWVKRDWPGIKKKSAD